MLDHLPPFRRQSVALGLYRMLTGTRFSISVVREAPDAAGLDAPHDAIAALRLHHCAPFAEMPPGFHPNLASATLALFTGCPVLCDVFLKDLAATAGLHPDEVEWVGDAVARTERTAQPTSEDRRGKEREAVDAPASAMERDTDPAGPQPFAARGPSARSTSPAPCVQALVHVAIA